MVVLFVICCVALVLSGRYGSVAVSGSVWPSACCSDGATCQEEAIGSQLLVGQTVFPQDFASMHLYAAKLQSCGKLTRWERCMYNDEPLARKR